jgi:hypothetical protein
MREFDDGVWCEEDVVTRLWLDDPPPYVRLDEREGETEEEEAGSRASAASDFDSATWRDPGR